MCYETVIAKKEHIMDFNQMLELIRTVSASELTAFQYEEGNQKILMHAGNVMWNDMTMGGMAAGGTLSASGMPDAIVPSNNKAKDNAGPADGNTGVQAASQAEGNLVKCPLVGKFYTAPSEEAEAYVKIGDHVKKGQVLAIVEAMKLMNEIESEYDGVVAEILAKDGEGVEYGQPLFRIA